MENEENQKQVSRRFPQPLEIAEARFPHSHSPATTARKSGNPKAGFPLSRRGSCSLKKKKKGDSPERRVPRRSGSSFDWNMLLHQSPPAQVLAFSCYGEQRILQ